MTNHDQFIRSPMASRRVRRHTMGVSNSEDSASTVSRSTVTVIYADRPVKIPQRDRPQDPAARETRVEDRPTVARLHDKIFKTHGERFVHKVLRSYAQDGSGLLSPDQLRAALDRLHVGMDQAERERIVARVVPDGCSRIHYMDFMRVFETPQPLGGEEVALARGTSVPGPPTVRPGGGGSGVGDGGTSYWNWQRHPTQNIPGLLDELRDGTAEQARSDSLLTGLLVTKMGHNRDKLRAVFRQMDANRNSVIDREEFARGIAKLRIDVSRPQIDRLFDLTDTDGDGAIDYEEFIARFEEPGLRKRAADQQAKERLRAASQGPPLTQTLALSPDEVTGALRHPLVLELARGLYGKGSNAMAVFQRHDMPRSGCLDVAAMTACCRTLVPGISERQVAAVMAAVDPATSGSLDYRRFLEGLVEDAVNHPRLAHSAPPGGNKGALARFGDQPLTVPSALPTPFTRALSAVSLSSHTATDEGSASGTVLPLPVGAVPTDRISQYELHSVAVAPVVESLARASGTVIAAALGSSASAVGGGGSDGRGGLLPSVTRSVDMGSLAVERQRREEAAAAGAGVGRTAAAESSRAPSHATGRFSRFWHRRYVDTTSITSADPASALYTPAEGAWVKKGANDDFLRFQAADREREARRRRQLVERYNARSEIDSRYSGQDDASGADDGRLATARAARQRYEERCEMYDRLRQRRSPDDHACFAHLPAFNEHKSDAANTPTRSYW